MALYSTFLSPFVTSNTYVISDSMYNEMKAKQHKDELKLLEQKLAYYEKQADNLRIELVKVNEEIAALLPEAKTESK